MKLSAGPDLKAFPVPKAVAHWYSIRRRTQVKNCMVKLQ